MAFSVQVLDRPEGSQHCGVCRVFVFGMRLECELFEDGLSQRLRLRTFGIHVAAMSGAILWR